MNLLDWFKLKLNFNWKLHFSNKKNYQPTLQDDYLPKLVDGIERQIENGGNLPFIIADIRERGFIIKIGGLYGFVSYLHMPWKYRNIDSWQAVFPTFKGKIFFCKIFHLEKNPLSIIVNGEIPQFKKYDLIENENYKGIIIQKTSIGLFIDIGYNFNWECGSIVGMLHKDNFDTDEAFNQTKTGDIIETTFWGYNENKQPLLGINSQLKEWLTREIDKFIGEIFAVKVVKINDNVINYCIADKYNATLPITRTIYGAQRTHIKNAVKQLCNGDIINCEVIHINHHNKELVLKWEFQHEIEVIISRKQQNIPQQPRPKKIEIINRTNSIENIVDSNIIDKLKLLDKTVKVEVVKKEDDYGRITNTYIVEGKFYGKLFISNNTYRISDKEKKMIEQNLQDGEFIECTVTGIDKNTLKLLWALKD